LQVRVSFVTTSLGAFRKIVKSAY